MKTNLSSIRTLRLVARRWFMAIVMLPWLSLTARGAQEGDFVYQTSDGGAAITAYAGPGGAVVIPDFLGGLPVTMIGSRAFWAQATVTSVTIPHTVLDIGENA